LPTTKYAVRARVARAQEAAARDAVARAGAQACDLYTHQSAAAGAASVSVGSGARRHLPGGRPARAALPLRPVGRAGSAAPQPHDSARRLRGRAARGTAPVAAARRWCSKARCGGSDAARPSSRRAPAARTRRRRVPCSRIRQWPARGARAVRQQAHSRRRASARVQTCLTQNAHAAMRVASADASSRSSMPALHAPRCARAARARACSETHLSMPLADVRPYPLAGTTRRRAALRRAARPRPAAHEAQLQQFEKGALFF
jgi:hypothetical protein